MVQQITDAVQPVELSWRYVLDTVYDKAQNWTLLTKIKSNIQIKYQQLEKKTSNHLQTMSMI